MQTQLKIKNFISFLLLLQDEICCIQDEIYLTK